MIPNSRKQRYTRPQSSIYTDMYHIHSSLLVYSLHTYTTPPKVCSEVCIYSIIHHRRCRHHKISRHFTVCSDQKDQFICEFSDFTNHRGISRYPQTRDKVARHFTVCADRQDQFICEFSQTELSRNFKVSTDQRQSSTRFQGIRRPTRSVHL